MSMIMKPTVHLNGSSVDHLIDDYEEAARAVLNALETIGPTTPNGRDYYPQGSSALSLAMKEHDARCARLRSVRDELMEILEDLLDQRDKRDAQKVARAKEEGR